MVTMNSKPLTGLPLLIDIFRKKDHWVGLDNIVELTNKVADNIDTIANSFDSVTENRKQLPYHLVELMILSEIAKVKLSIMPSEWNEHVDEVVERMINENKPNFDEMEF